MVQTEQPPLTVHDETRRSGSFPTETIDVNAASDSATLEVANWSRLTAHAVVASGTFATAVLTAEGSLNGTDWTDLEGPVTITPSAPLEHGLAISLPFIRFRVSTQEGGAGTVDLHVTVHR